MHKKRIVFLMIWICLLFLLPTDISVRGANSYSISSYKIDINVDKSAVFQVVETMQIENAEDLKVQKDILQKYTYDLTGKGEEIFVYGISDIQVENAEFKTSRMDGLERLHISLTSPSQEVVVRYKVRMRNMEQNEQSVILYNILQPTMEATIASLQMSLTLPNRPDTSFEIYKTTRNGDKGAALSYQLNDKTITLQTAQSIEAGTGIMMFANIRKFYFTYSNPITMHVFVALLSIAVVVLSYALIVYMPRHKVKKLSKETYPLENVSPGVLGYLYDGVCDHRDIMLIIIAWANQNYIQIRDENQTVSLVIVKELPITAKPYEKRLFDLIFTDYMMVTIEQLKQRCLYDEMTRIVNDIYLEQHIKANDPIFSYSSLSWQMLSALLVTLPMSLTIFACKYEETYEVVSSLVYGLGSSGLVFLNCVPWIWILKYRYRLTKNAADVYQILIGSLNLVCGALVYSYLFQHDTPIVYIVISVILTILYACVMLIMEKRTHLGNVISHRLNSLRNFISEARPPQLSSLLRDNPYYFEDMLPYAYVFDIVDIWGKKFTSIPLQAPFWYFHINAESTSTLYWMSSMEKSLKLIQDALLTKDDSFYRKKKKGKHSSRKKKHVYKEIDSYR